MTESKSIIFDQKHAIHQAERISYLFGGMYVPLGPGLSKSSRNPYFSLKDDFLSQHYRIPPFLFNLPPCPFLPMDLLRMRIPSSTNFHLSDI